MTDHATPEWVFEANWAAALVDTAFKKLQDEWAAKGRLEEFLQAKSSLLQEDERTYAEVAKRQHTTADAFKMRVLRLRHEFREFFVREVAATVPPFELEDELQYVYRVLTSSPSSMSKK